MKWITKEAKDLESKVLEGISAEELWRHTETIAQWVRLSGSTEEAQAFDYIKRVLQGYGARVEAYEFDSLIGLPEEASLEVISPETKRFEGIAHALVPSTPPEGVEGELVYVGRGNPAAYAGAVDVRGKAVLIEGLGSPQKARLAEDRGAIGQIFINDDQTHEFAVSAVWGTPTPETASLLQSTPCISIKGAAGAYLKERLGHGPVRVRVKARSWKGWRKIPVVTGEFKGAKEPTFVLLSGHVDSWYYGAMDNAGANATALELVRVLSSCSQLRRGLRVAFWSGHSHGRYSGSAWYADNLWEDLHENCVAHVNIDSTGGRGATRLSGADTMAEAWAFAAGVIKKLTGQELERRRMGRMGDQSFWGCGVPSLFVSLSEQSLETQRGGFGGGMGWWWHTPEDTIDKLDRGNLLRDARVYALAVARLCALPVLPFDYSATGDEFLTVLSGLQERTKGVFGLGRCLARAEEFKNEAALLGEAIDRLLQDNRAADEHNKEEAFAVANRALMELGRILIPISYTSAGPFDQDLAVPLPPLPVLQPVMQLASLNPSSDGFRFLHTRLVRESNKVCHALRQAAATAREGRLKLEGVS